MHMSICKYIPRSYAYMRTTTIEQHIFPIFRLLDSWNMEQGTHTYLYHYICAYTLLVRDDPTCIFDHIGKVIFWSKLPVICNYAHYAYASMRWGHWNLHQCAISRKLIKSWFLWAFSSGGTTQLLLPVALVRPRLVTDWVPDIGFLGTWNQPKN